MKIPFFKYHPNPIETGNIKVSEETCICCGEVKGFIYTGPIYSVEELEECFCPWCISNGNAAEIFDVYFTDTYALFNNGISKEIIEEVGRRTPGFVSWQGEQWLSHCNDACIFLGDAKKDDIKNIIENNIEIESLSNLSNEKWQEIYDNYQPGGQPAFYKFQCLHCNQILYYADYT